MRRCLSDRATREARDATRRRAASREATTEAGRRASRASRRPAGPPRRRRRRVAGPRMARRERPLLASARASRRHAQENAEGSRRAAGPTNASPSKRANDAPTSPRDVEPALWRPRMARDTGAGRSGGCPVTARGHTHQPAVFPKSASARRWGLSGNNFSPCLDWRCPSAVLACAWEAVWKICWPPFFCGLGANRPRFGASFRAGVSLGAIAAAIKLEEVARRASRSRRRRREPPVWSRRERARAPSSRV